MNIEIHTSESRGHADHGWLNTHHSFSFAGYFNPERMQFGALRVLNDDIVKGGMGFREHPHDNMEIISIPLQGELEHKDSMGNVQVIREDDIQILSAGSGMTHSEFNRNRDQDVNFLQIWIIPNERNVEPRYDQMNMKADDRKNRFQQVASPNKDDEGIWMHQNAWFHRGEFDAVTEANYQMKGEGNGLYVFLLEGEISIDDKSLKRRDAAAITETGQVDFKIGEKSDLLLIEVPLSKYV